MARWEPQAAERLRAAALELFLEHGYDSVTVAQIAERAGLTRRTFSRYFAIACWHDRPGDPTERR